MSRHRIAATKPGAAIYSGQVVLVSGASRGIGRGLALHFLARGAVVVGMSRGPGTVEDPRYTHVVADLLDEAALSALVLRVRREHGRLDVLVNNAAVATSQPAVTTTAAAIGEQVGTNFVGAVVLSREAARLMMARRYGRIIHLGSMMVPQAPIGSGIYGATKAALMQFSAVTARELAAFNITSNVLGVSAVETELWGELSQDKLKSVLLSLPVPRPATIEEVAHVVDFFAHPASGNVTGQVVYLNGVS